MSPRMRELHTRIRETYKDRTAFSRADRAKLFDIPLEQRLQQRPFNLVKWLQTEDTTDRVRMSAGQPRIYSYFHPTRPPDTSGLIEDNN